jgi:quercetin dioxygenase-like cupin family protein
MHLKEHPTKGIANYLLDQNLNGEPLHLHISEVGPGGRSHPPHKHGGIESIYMLEGEGTFEIDGESYTLQANEATVFDPRKLHGLANYSSEPIKYMVIIYRDEEE